MQGPAGTKCGCGSPKILNPDGTLYTENLRTAKATDHFILSGNGVEEFTPQFTFHGFRYAEITGLPDGAGQGCGQRAGLPHRCAVHGEARDRQRDDQPAVEQHSLGAAVELRRRARPIARSATSGWAGWAMRRSSGARPATTWTWRLSRASLPRDMRGTQVGHALLRHLFAGHRRSRTWAHAAGWSDAGVIIPWTSWLQTGDTSIIEQNWDAMEKYLECDCGRQSRWPVEERLRRIRLATGSRPKARRIRC